MHVRQFYCSHYKCFCVVVFAAKAHKTVELLVKLVCDSQQAIEIHRRLNCTQRQVFFDRRFLTILVSYFPFFCAFSLAPTLCLFPIPSLSHSLSLLHRRFLIHFIEAKKTTTTETITASTMTTTTMKISIFGAGEISEGIFYNYDE